MESAVISSAAIASSSNFGSHLKGAASPLWARTLPKQQRRGAVAADSAARHHTYPRVTPPRRPPIPSSLDTAADTRHDIIDVDMTAKSNGVVKLSGNLAREVANAWSSRIGKSDQPAPADRIQSLFYDIELYPTKTQVFEMLVCARQCARRKSLTLTFGEFCVFAAELRKCSRQARQAQPKPESPIWSAEKEATCKQKNGSEASPPPCEVFLGGSCNPTTWRSDIAIPMLNKMGITYFNPQVEDWSTELVEVEHRAKAAARALLFVLDNETRAVAASVEAAHLAAAPRDLLLVLKPYSRHQTIARETISDIEYIELSRARATLQEAVERRGLPAFADIPAALRCARAVLRGARTHPRYSLGHTILRLKRAFDSAGGRTSPLPREKALDTLKDVTRVPRDIVDACLPPAMENVDFETFCSTVAELAAVEVGVEGSEGEARVAGGVLPRLRRALHSLRERFAEYRNGGDTAILATATPGDASAPTNGLHSYNARLRACGKKLSLFIPKSQESRADSARTSTSSTTGTTSAGTDAGEVFTPGTQRRLERLPGMLGAPQHHVYLAGSFPTDDIRPDEFLRSHGLTFAMPRANDYTRMFSTPARRTAAAHPESPRTDKKPRPMPDDNQSEHSEKLRTADCSQSEHAETLRTADCSQSDADPATGEAVSLRDKDPFLEPAARLSASDFYTVTENVTPQPFKGTYDEDLILGSRILVFSLNATSPCFAAMVLAAHYMGLRPRHTVLVVQTMNVERAQPYSSTAVKDYNRGRHYLCDLARRSGVPVFDTTTAAMQCVLAKLGNKNQC